jgi:hypothetical protein
VWFFTGFEIVGAFFILCTADDSHIFFLKREGERGGEGRLTICDVNTLTDNEHSSNKPKEGGREHIEREEDEEEEEGLLYKLQLISFETKLKKIK